jgi:hypothetical protein
LEQLCLPRLGHESLTGAPDLHADGDHSHATVQVRYPGGATRAWRIREDSRIWRVDKK